MTIEFDKINQLIIIKKPDVEIVCQDLINAIRDYEDDLLSFDVAKIANANGKDDLGGGVLVGITLTLLNWRLQFEARTELEGWTICKVSGGNLVAVDENGDSISPIAPSAYVNVILANSSSATLQELTTIQNSSFNNGITVDPLNGVDSLIFPAGTPQAPVKTCDYVMSLAELRCFKIIYVLNDFNISNHDMSGYTMIGLSPRQTHIGINNILWFGGCLKECSFSGYFSDGSVIEVLNCEIGNVENITLNARNCYLSGTIILNNTRSSNFYNCVDGIPGSGVPVINIDDCESLGIWDYSGGLKIINLVNGCDVSVNLQAGRVILDESCTGGTLIIRGIGSLVNNSSIPTANINKIGLLDLPSITSSVWSANKNDLTTSNSIGQYIVKKLLTVSKFLGLK